MPTMKQLLNKKTGRKPKTKWIKTPALDHCPQKQGSCIRVFTRTPKKPNSALRKVAKVRLSNNKRVEAYIPGIGHNLQQYSSVLMRGGRVKDLPGVKYHLIRNKLDFRPVALRTNGRSKYGVKRTSF